MKMIGALIKASLSIIIYAFGFIFSVGLICVFTTVIGYVLIPVICIGLVVYLLYIAITNGKIRR